MRIKRCAALFLAALTALALAGCRPGDSKSVELSVRPAQLTEEEKNFAALLSVGLDGYRIFQFQTPEGGADTIRINTYELLNGEWSLLVGGEGMPFTGETGRIALTFGKLTDGVGIAFQAGGETNASSYRAEPEDDVSRMTCASSVLGEEKTVELGEEVPLVLQIVTSKTEISSYGVEYFGMPKDLDRHGYEHVYAITALFSEKSTFELAESAAPEGEQK